MMRKLNYGCRSLHPENQIPLTLCDRLGLYDFNPSYKYYLISQDEQDKYLRAIAYIKECGFRVDKTISQPYPKMGHFK
jgi:hypothetical protein